MAKNEVAKTETTAEVEVLAPAVLSTGSIIVPENISRPFGDDSLEEFAKQLKKDGGLTNPITVREKLDGKGNATGKYILIAGNRRLGAYKLLGWDEIPVYVRTDVNDIGEAMRLNISENRHRKDQTPMEFALSMEAFAKETGTEMTGGALGKALGVNATTVTQHLKLLTITDKKVREAIHNGMLKYKSAVDFADFMNLEEVKSLSEKKQAEIRESLLTTAQLKQAEKEAAQEAAAVKKAEEKAAKEVAKDLQKKADTAARKANPPTTDMKKQAAQMAKEIKEKKLKAAAEAAKKKLSNQKTAAGTKGKIETTTMKEAMTEVAEKHGVKSAAKITSRDRGLDEFTKVVALIDGLSEGCSMFAKIYGKWKDREMTDVEFSEFLRGIIVDD